MVDCIRMFREREMTGCKKHRGEKRIVGKGSIAMGVEKEGVMNSVGA